MAGGIAKVVKKFTKQTLVYWAKNGSNQYGKPTYADPVEIKCRWEDRTIEVIGPEGRTVLAAVYILLAEGLLPGSLVMLGKLTDVQALSTYPRIPTMGQGTREIIRSNETPDLKARSSVFEAFAG